MSTPSVRFARLLALPLAALVACSPAPEREPPKLDADAPSTTLKSVPTAYASVSQATFEFEVDETDVSFSCALDEGEFTACASPHVIEALSEGPHVLVVRATDAAGNVEASPPRHEWVVDTIAPTTTIDTEGPLLTRDDSISLTFSADETEVSFECALDENAFSACTSPVTYEGLDEGTHRVEVRASDRAGNTEAEPAPFVFRVDASAPVVTFEITPAAGEADSVIVFSANEADCTFTCSLDEASAVSCQAPLTLSGLGDGPHALSVVATDPAGNQSDVARLSWTVDTRPPESAFTAVDAGPAATSATFRFEADEPAAFTCALDEEPPVSCESPVTLEQLAEGTHVFTVRTRDLAGNDATAPLVHEWTVDTQPPTTTITSAPGEVQEEAAVFVFESELGATFECQVDEEPFEACTSPFSLEVEAGEHSFTVRATDAAGNVEVEPPSVLWKKPSFTPLRIVAANLTSGNLQSYDLNHGRNILKGLRPDVILIQEFNVGDNSAAAVRAFVTAVFGEGFSYYRESGAQIPNGVISRYPIIESGEWTDPEVANRDFAWARIDLPGEKDLWAVSVHLVTRSAADRNTEAAQIVTQIKAKVPEGDYLVVGGNLNTDSRSESCLSTLSQVVVTQGPHPADKNGNTATNAGRTKPYDHVLVNEDLVAHQVATVIGQSTFTSGLVADTRVYSPIFGLAPAVAGDSGASMMQHMAVVKDFLVPGE